MAVFIQVLPSEPQATSLTDSTHKYYGRAELCAQSNDFVSQCFNDKNKNTKFSVQYCVFHLQYCKRKRHPSFTPLALEREVKYQRVMTSCQAG